MTAGGITEGIAIHVATPANHGRASNNILTHRLINKTDRRDNWNILILHLLCIKQCQYPAEVINMTVRKYHPGNINRTEMLLSKIHGNATGFEGGERVYNNPSIITFNQAHIGEIKTAQLIEPFLDLKKTSNAV